MPARTTLKYRLCRDRDCAKSNKSPFLNLEQSNEMECKEGPAAPKTPPRNTAEKEVRNYPEQPPVIPHTTQGYRIDINGNKCLSCYAGTCTAPHWLAGDAVLIAPVSNQIPWYQGILQGILRFWGSETRFSTRKPLRCSHFSSNSLRRLSGKIF